MKSKYSAAEIEAILDKMAVSLNKNLVITDDLVSLDDVDGEKILSANTALDLFRKIQNLQLFDKPGFINYINGLPGYQLMSDADKDKIGVNDFIVSPKDSLSTLGTITKYQMGLVKSSIFGSTNLYVVDSNNEVNLITGNQSKLTNLTAGSHHEIQIRHTQPMNWINVKMIAITAIGLEIIELNVVRDSSNKWHFQVTNDTRQNTNEPRTITNLKLVSETVVINNNIVSPPAIEFDVSRATTEINTVFKSL